MLKNSTDNLYYALVGHKYQILTSREMTGGSYTLIEGLIPPLKPEHLHIPVQERIYDNV